MGRTINAISNIHLCWFCPLSYIHWCLEKYLLEILEWGRKVCKEACVWLKTDEHFMNSSIVAGSCEESHFFSLIAANIFHPSCSLWENWNEAVHNGAALDGTVIWLTQSLCCGLLNTAIACTLILSSKVLLGVWHTFSQSRPNEDQLKSLIWLTWSWRLFLVSAFYASPGEAAEEDF